VAVAPAIFLLDALVDDLQSRRIEPASYPVPAGVVVVAGATAVDDFAAYRREPAMG
jgi:hypothetical protein